MRYSTFQDLKVLITNTILRNPITKEMTLRQLEVSLIDMAEFY